ncbi:unnamed protein product [Urochloa humidicola]
MARLLHLSLIAPAIISLLLLAALAPAATTAAANPPVKKPGVRFRYANKEESRWLDRYAETHGPLGSGPLRMRRATEEESKWLNSMGSGSGDGSGDDGRRYIEFDEDNPYVEALQAWASRLIKEGLAKAQAEDV